MLELDVKSRVPIYEQLVEKIKELIIMEVLKEHEQLPSVRSLASELTINPNTIQKAYRELENQGYIYSIPGKGNFVAPINKNKKLEKVNKLKEELKRLILEAIYLGITKEELMELYDSVNKEIKEGRR
ncbi:MAG: GntR family transcriptional regulator [Caloramator sp.]|nr:GntR family transcriptional regulator [Caloramator sp.]